jgi:NAD(P)-dependent dehydrogenase (short-subunit alcohol dehydrogenase family)
VGTLVGKTAIVTGSGRGIGRAIAKAFASQGAVVAVVSRTEAQVAETCREIASLGGKAAAVAADVTDRAAVEHAVRRVEAELGPPDVLVNNAGSFGAVGPVVEADPDAWWHDVTVNILGPFLCTRAVLPGMLSRRRGRIINMTGGGMAGPLLYGSGYASSKAALQRFTETLDKELEGSGVLAFSMGPGLVRTAMTEGWLTTEEGRKWFGKQISELFDTGQDVPPTRAAALAAEIASGRLDALHGRNFAVRDTPEALLADAERIVRDDLKTLRLRSQ